MTSFDRDCESASHVDSWPHTNGPRTRVRLPLLLLAVVLTPSLAPAQDTRLDDDLRLTLARKLRVPQSALELLRKAEVDLPYIGRKLVTAKLRERSTGRIHEVTLDAASGKSVVKRSLQLANQARKHAKLGKLDPGLLDSLHAARRDEKLDVAIWLHAPSAGPDRVAARQGDMHAASALGALADARTRARKTRLQELQAPVLAHLRASHAEIMGASDRAPLVFAKLDSRQIRALARHPRVAALYRSGRNGPLLDVSIHSVEAPAAWWHGAGGGGEGAGVGVIEQAGIDFSHPNLDSPFRVGINRVGTCVGSHPTLVAGVVGSAHPDLMGVAPSASLYGGEACSWSDTDLQTATTWAVGVGARVSNNSWGDRILTGTPTALSRFHDVMTRDWGVTMVDAAGNEGPTRYLRAPAIAYNVIAVGSYDDRNTIDWADDIMSSFSSAGNPISAHGDREKPELAAPGTAVTTTRMGGGVSSVDGTSFAAPHVAGAAAVLISHNRDGYLWTWPEGIKAILMASARNVEGDSRLSDLDGAGGLSVYRAVQIVDDPSQWSLATLYPGDATRTFPFQAEAGQTVRAVIAWDATPDYALYDSQPGVDLDLYVNAPSGFVVALSLSYDNTYEIVEFVAPETGTYQLTASAMRFEDPFTYLGVAWSH